ncbi:hypothetical protein [Caballeronia grimmiae]|uniref:hypothetical protein n=1 Tax=Caballeronia grimmiae TaxID=1071679 RepID=UPI0038B9AB72
MDTESVDFAVELLESRASDDELVAGLGEHSVDSFGFEDASFEEKKLAGLSWWAEHSEEIKSVVCKFACEKDASSALAKDLVAMVFALLGAKFGLAVAAYAAAIAVRRVTAGWCGRDAESA